MREHRAEPITSALEQESRARHATDQAFDFSRSWLDSKAAAAYVGNKSVKGFYDWCRRHFIVRRNNGTVARADLDRALKAKRPKRVMAAASLANLRKRG